MMFRASCLVSGLLFGAFPPLGDALPKDQGDLCLITLPSAQASLLQKES